MIADGGRGLYRGCHWGAETRYAVLDIDADTSQYHDSEKLSELLTHLDGVGLRVILYRSSASGGWHLYIPFDRNEPSREVEKTFERWLKVLGFEVKGGQLEVFPSGNALRLPLQPGFAWLDRKGNIVQTREELNRDEALASFLSDLKTGARSWTEAKHRIESQISACDRAIARDAQAHAKAISCEGLEDLFTELTRYRVIPEHCAKARQYLIAGLTKPKTRHEAIYTIQHLLWHGDRALGVPQLPGLRNADRRYQFLRRWIEANHNGFCSHINRGDWDSVEGHIRRVCTWRRSEGKADFEHEPYMETERAQDRLVELQVAKKKVLSMDFYRVANERREGEARIKIKRAVGDCLQQGRQISRSTLEAITRCSPNTVRKHGDLWKHLATGSGVLILGGAGPFCPLPDLSEIEVLERFSSNGLGDAYSIEETRLFLNKGK